MELPRKILIGEGVVSEVGSVVRSLDSVATKAAIITGAVVKARAGEECSASLEKSSFKSFWHVVNDASMDTVARLQEKIADRAPDFMIGFGGGRSVDVAKMTAFKIGRPFLSVPTSASHDGISSPFVSIRAPTSPIP